MCTPSHFVCLFVFQLDLQFCVVKMFATVSEERLEMRKHIASMRRLRTMEKERDSFISTIMKDHERMNKQLMKYRFQQVQRQLAIQVHHIFSEISVPNNTDSQTNQTKRNTKKSKKMKSKVQNDIEAAAFDVDDVCTQMELLTDSGAESTNRSNHNSTAYYSTSTLTPKSVGQSVIPNPTLTKNEEKNQLTSTRAYPDFMPTEIHFSKTISKETPKDNKITRNHQQQPTMKGQVSKPLFGTITLRECWVGKPEAIGSIRRKLRSNAERQFQKHLENLLNKSEEFNSKSSAQQYTEFTQSGRHTPMVIHRGKKGISIALSPSDSRKAGSTEKESNYFNGRRCKSAFVNTRKPENQEKLTKIRPMTSSGTSRERRPISNIL